MKLKLERARWAISGVIWRAFMADYTSWRQDRAFRACAGSGAPERCRAVTGTDGSTEGSPST